MGRKFEHYFLSDIKRRNNYRDLSQIRLEELGKSGKGSGRGFFRCIIPTEDNHEKQGSSVSAGF